MDNENLRFACMYTYLGPTHERISTHVRTSLHAHAHAHVFSPRLSLSLLLPSSSLSRFYIHSYMLFCVCVDLGVL